MKSYFTSFSIFFIAFIESSKNLDASFHQSSGLRVNPLTASVDNATEIKTEKECPFCSTVEPIVPDIEWNQVCSAGSTERWFLCTPTSLYVLRERRVNRFQAKDQCDTLYLTRWPSKFFSGVPFPKVKAGLVSIQTCEELKSVSKLAAQFMKYGHSSKLPIWTDDLRPLRKQDSQFTDHHNSVVVTVIKNVSKSYAHSTFKPTTSRILESDKLRVDTVESHSNNVPKMAIQSHSIQPEPAQHNLPSEHTISPERQNSNSHAAVRWQQLKLDSRSSRSIGFGLKWFKIFAKPYNYPKPAFDSLFVSGLVSPSNKPYHRALEILETHEYIGHRDQKADSFQKIDADIKKQKHVSEHHFSSFSANEDFEELHSISKRERLGWETKNERIALVQVNLHPDQLDSPNERPIDQPVKRWLDPRLCEEDVSSSMETRKVQNAEFAKLPTDNGELVGFALCEIRRSSIKFESDKVTTTIKYDKENMKDSENDLKKQDSTTKADNIHNGSSEKKIVMDINPEWVQALEAQVGVLANGSFNGTIKDTTGKNLTAIQIGKRFHEQLQKNRLGSPHALQKLLNISEQLQFRFEEEMRNQTHSGEEERQIRHNFTDTLLKGYSAMLDDQQKEAWENGKPEVRTDRAEQIIRHIMQLAGNSVCVGYGDDHKPADSLLRTPKHVVIQARHIMTSAMTLPERLPNGFRFPSSSQSVEGTEFDQLWLEFLDGLDVNSTLQKSSLTNSQRKSVNDGYRCGLKQPKGYSMISNATNLNHVAVGILITRLSQHLISRQPNSAPNNNISISKKTYLEPTLDELVHRNLVRVGSAIIVFSLDANPDHSHHLPQPVQMTIGHDSPLAAGQRPICAFWNVVTGNWDTEGCRLVDGVRGRSICECNHLTSFAVLIDLRGQKQQHLSTWWERISAVCSALSIVGLVVTAAIFLLIRRLRNRRNLITAHLCICLVIVNLLVSFALETRSKIACTLVSMVLYWALMSAFAWMAAEGYFLYQMVIVVFNANRIRFKRFYWIGYGSGAMQTLVLLAAFGPKVFYDPDHSYYCWLSTQDKSYQLLVVVAPVIVVLLTNFIIVIGSAFETARLGRRRTKPNQQGPIRSAPQHESTTTTESKSDQTTTNETAARTVVDAISLAATALSAKAAQNQKAMESTIVQETAIPEPKRMCQWHGWISLVMLLGLTWVIGIISFTLNSTLGNQLFVVTNGLQGFYIFLLEVAFNPKNRITLKRAITSQMSTRYFWTSEVTRSSQTISERSTRLSEMIQRASRRLSGVPPRRP